jgi:hypothetical protein
VRVLETADEIAIACVKAIQSGDIVALRNLLERHSDLATARLGDPRVECLAPCCTWPRIGRGTSRMSPKPSPC